MRYSQDRIRELISDVRRRWRRRAVIQGGSLAIGVLVAWSILLLALRWASEMPPAATWIGSVIGLLLFVGCLVRYVALPAVRKIDDQQIAMLIEESIPELEDRLNSAVELENPAASRRAHAVLIDRLIDDAAERARVLPLTAVVDRRREKILSSMSAAGFVFVLLLGYFALDGIPLWPGEADLGSLVASSRPYMTVDPGNVEIDQGGSQDVVVTLRAESDESVVLHYRTGEGDWIRQEMQAAVTEPAFLHEFIDVQEPISYFVEHDERRSDVYKVSLYTFPEVERIDLTYNFPEYTGQAPRREEDTGDIYGLYGSVVTLEIATNGVAESAELILDDASRIPLESTGGGGFRGTIQLEREATYRVQLVDAEAKQNKFPQEYTITPVPDERPLITITDPQRDVRANAIEEVLVTARVQDDFGVDDVRLRFAVNADEEQTVDLKAADADDPTDVEGEHLFFLEDFGLEPGDVISYFVEAKDGFHAEPEVTDMYFIEVIPFDREYTQAGAGGGMSGGPSGTVLSQQQIIAATWKLHRERSEMPSGEYASSRRALAQAQENLRSNIDERISQTAFSLELQQDPENRQLVEHLRKAVAAMGGAVKEIEADRLREALTPEREALNHLLKADALNRERRVALNRGGQGGGGGAATEERMTELMDLELDISKDKYETLPQSSRSNAGGEVDEALEKLRELARRQQNLANENRHTLEGEDKKRHVERLQRDQNELRQQAQSLRRQLQQTARSQGSSGEGMEQSMERVAENMREAERALREGNTQQAQARQQQALNELEKLTQDLRREGNDDSREALEEMQQAYDQLREQEESLARALDRERRASQQRQGRLDADALDELAAQREGAREALERIHRTAEELAGRSSQDRELAAATRNLQKAIQREDLEAQMRDSEESIRRGWLDNAQRRQQSIVRGLERIDEAVRELEGRMPVTDEERLARSLDALEELERELRALQEESLSQSSPNGQRSERASAASRQARLDRAREQLSRLRQEMGRTPALDALDGAVARAGHAGVSLEGESARAFFNDEVFAPLSQLEEAIMQDLDRLAMERKLYGSRPGRVPAEYRELVEKYYETLSKSGSE